MVAIDIDGTLLSSQGELSAKVRNTIAATVNQGIHVTLATGRRLSSTLPWVEALNLQVPFIAHNGALVVEPRTKHVRFKQGISLPVANKIIDELMANKIPHLVYYGDAQGDLGRMAEVFCDYRQLFLTYIDDRFEFVKEHRLATDPIKISVLGENELINLASHDWKAVYGQHSSMVTYDSELYTGIDFTGPGCSKASGVSFIAKMLGIGLAEVLAIGDAANDLAMIKSAGLGVAMQNAPEDIKRAADYVTLSNDEDGVAHVLEEFCLK